MKITYSTSKINSFGGLNFANSIIGNAQVFDTIDQMLGTRGIRAQYRYSDLFRSYLLITLCGGACAEDITEHLRGELSQVRNFDVCSADTLLRMQKELVTGKETFVSKTNIRHNFNINITMNKLLVKLLVQTGQLSPEHEGYIFDYDNQFLSTEKYDSKRSYKKADGYFPGIASINNYPVYIENRNGNSNVKYKQDETLKRAFALLAEPGIKVKHSRMDCGSFDKTVVPVVEANSTYFYIRAQRCGNLYDDIRRIADWETATIGFKEYQVASIEYAPFGWDKTYRYVISREKKADGQGDLFTGDSFTYRAIMTNNYEMTDKEIVEFYNHRGDSERLFDEMNNDFLWKKMPFSFLHENTVFLVMMAICRNLFHFLTEFISRKLDFIKPNFRLKKFIFRFMVVPSKWIKKGRQNVLKLFTSKKYHLLLE
ncbi:MAG TPA: IS1380 family transposase [Draconibacterium sp.]|nr:IS1380 family transposase [Draconibacterium sp.]